MEEKSIYTFSGRNVNDLRMAAVLSGEVTADDFRIRAETLHYQADKAQSAGYRQLSQNLRRAAELTRISNEEVFGIYNALRPRRSTYRQLITLADRLDHDEHAPLTADLIRQAAEIYAKRGILRQEEQGSLDLTATIKDA